MFMKQDKIKRQHKSPNIHDRFAFLTKIHKLQRNCRKLVIFLDHDIEKSLCYKRIKNIYTLSCSNRLARKNIVLN
jgi:hypothetical protein